MDPFDWSFLILFISSSGRITNDESSMFLSKTPQNMAESSNFLLSYQLLATTLGNQSQPMLNLQCSIVFPLQQWVKYLKIYLKHQISYFDWWWVFIIQDGYHMRDPIWLPMLPAAFIKIWSFPLFFSFLMFSPPPTTHYLELFTVNGTWITVCTVFVHDSKKVTEKLFVIHTRAIKKW